VKYIKRENFSGKITRLIHKETKKKYLIYLEQSNIKLKNTFVICINSLFESYKTKLILFNKYNLLSF